MAWPRTRPSCWPRKAVFSYKHQLERAMSTWRSCPYSKFSPQQSRAYTIGHPPWSNHIFSRRKLFCISFQIRSERRTDSWKLLLPIVLRKAFFPPCFRWEKQRDRSGDLSWNEYDWFTSDLLQAISSLNLPLFFFYFERDKKKGGGGRTGSGINTKKNSAFHRLFTRPLFLDAVLSSSQ